MNTDLSVNASRSSVPKPVESTYVAENPYEVANRRKTSPTLLNPIAENAEEMVSVRDDHVEMRRKLIKPTISQERSRAKIPVEFSTSHTAKRNETRRSEKITNWESNSR